MLNVDCKLLSGVLAHRMKGMLMKVISGNRKGFLKNRYIDENTRFVNDIMSYFNKTKKNDLLLITDFEKQLTP